MGSSDWVTRADLQDAIQAGRLRLDSLLNKISDEDKLKPVLDEGWSIKDTLAHVFTWEQRLLGWLAAATTTGGTPQIPAPGYSWDNINELNQITFEQKKRMTLSEVEESYQASMGLLYAALDRLSDEDLNSRYFETEEEALWQFFAANTYLHYEEHGEAIRAWVDGG